MRAVQRAHADSLGGLLAAALHSGDSAFEDLPDYFRAKFEPALTSLLDAAVAEGQARAGIVPYDLLRAIGNLSVASGEGAEAHVGTMVRLLIDGLMSVASNRE